MERLRFLSAIYAVDVCAYAVMSNHFHLVVRVEPARALAWDEDEIAERYAKVLTRTSRAAKEPMRPTPMRDKTADADPTEADLLHALATDAAEDTLGYRPTP